jgi:hypothetical protein
MKAYKDSNDDVWLLDPIETQRFNSSASRMAMPDYQTIFMEGLNEVKNG